MGGGTTVILIPAVNRVETDFLKGLSSVFSI